jgi:cytochrome oxidase assembly protein ShyY1
MSKVAASKVASKVTSKVAASRSFGSKVVPSKVAASSKVTASADTKFVTGNLSNSGKFFFGSLCVGTFGLGCWQLDRLYEKLDKIDDREQQLQMTPILYNNNNSYSYNNNYTSNDIITSDDDNSSKTNTNPYRRRLLRGVFRHEKEVLIGPRGAPAGVQMPLSGLSAKKAKNNNNTSTAGGMQPGPQGYHILTPMELVNDDDNSTDDNKKDDIVWINRGWVPKSIVPGANQSHFRNSNTGQIDIIAKTKLTAELKNAPCTWNRPTGLQEMTVIISKPESTY